MKKSMTTKERSSMKSQNRIVVMMQNKDGKCITIEPFISSLIPDSTATTMSPANTFLNVPKYNIKSFGVEQIKVSLPPAIKNKKEVGR